MTTRVRIGIAVVESAGCVLVGQRPEGVPLPGLAEFPGGKCETGEIPRSCVVRECREETGLIIVPREHLATVEHSYPHGDVELHFWRCGLSPGLPDHAVPSAPFRWVSFEELATLNFPEANRTVLDQLLTRT
jgi:8-oxo-dGTP diphosphatase